MRMRFPRQSVHSSLAASGISGIRTAGSGGLPSWSCQTNSSPLRTSVVHDRVRAILGVRLAYGTNLQRPSPPQRQSWNGQATSSPLTVPSDRSPPMCRQ
ncbi:Uncharacterised protein [Mycobacterium tuberculosis]|nr:Uncharacterised protein [Mycobacterium tuberculosis]